MNFVFDFRKTLLFFLFLSILLVAQGSTGDAQESPSPFNPVFVIIDKQEIAYTVYIAIPGGISEKELGEIKAEAAKQKGMEIVPWDKFEKGSNDYIMTRIVSNEYPEYQIEKGIVDLIKISVLTPVGLTWNGGVAISNLDYQYAKKTYQKYLDNPVEYERTKNRNPSLDPVDPSNHFVPLLGKDYKQLIFAEEEVRRVSERPYEKLVGESDIVAIVEPLENKPARDAFSGNTYGHPTSDFAATNTRFQVHAVLKVKGDVPKELTVLHFAYNATVRILRNASFVRFFIGPLNYEKRNVKPGTPFGDVELGNVTVFGQKPIWLAFLKRREDGRFEPVSGQYDSALSFRELHEPSFYTLP